MSLHNLMKLGIPVPRSNVQLFVYHKPVLSRLFSRTCLHQDSYHHHSKPNQVEKAESSSGKLSINLFNGRSPKLLTLSPQKNSQLCNSISTSSFNNAKYGNVKTSKSFEFFSLRSLISTPAPFLLYGIGGLIPFTSVPIYILITSTYCPMLAHAQLVYGACILSFLGGVAWGNELNSPEKSTLKSLGYSISLPLIGWLGVLAHPSITAFPIVISGTALAGYTDTQIKDYPLWFKNLRFMLSMLVIISLMGSFSLSFIYPDSDNSDKKV